MTPIRIHRDMSRDELIDAIMSRLTLEETIEILLIPRPKDFDVNRLHGMEVSKAIKLIRNEIYGIE